MDSSSQPEITPELLEANPLLALALTLFSFFFLAALAGSIASWILLGTALWKRKSILPVADWTPRPWGLVDLVLGFICLVIAQILLTTIAAPVLGIDLKTLSGDDSQLPLTISAVISASYLLAVVMISMWIVFRFHSNLQEIGWGLKRFPRLLLIGVLGGLAFLPVLFALNALVVLVSETEYNHPILDSMKADGTPVSFLLAVFSAAVAAPIAEEFLFRGLLQGWLQSLPLVNIKWGLLGRTNELLPQPEMQAEGTDVRGTQVVEGSDDRDQIDRNRFDGNQFERSVLDREDEPSVAAPPDEGQPNRGNGGIDSCAEMGSYSNPFATPSDQSHLSRPLEERAVVPAIWPSLVAGTLFGLAHWGYGLSFIPLIFLGIFLGMLYRATQSLWPCIMVHFMLNASSMAALGINILIEKATNG